MTNQKAVDTQKRILLISDLQCRRAFHYPRRKRPLNTKFHLTRAPPSRILIFTCSNNPYVEGPKKFPKTRACIDVKPHTRSAGAPPAGQRSIGGFRRIVVRAGLSLFVLVTIFAVALLWKPGGVSSAGGHPTFLQALLAGPLPAAVADLVADGKAAATFTETNLLDLLRSALDTGDATVPDALSREVRRNVPDFVEPVGCRFSPDAVSLFLRCKKVVSFYVTVSGRLACLPDGSVRFNIVSVRVGLLPVPPCLYRGAVRSDMPIISAGNDSPVVVTGVVSARGTLTIDLDATQRGSQWLKTFLNL